MAEIMGTVTSVKRYLSPEKIELKISPDLGGESTIILQQKHRLTRAHREKQLKMSCQALHNAPPNRT